MKKTLEYEIEIFMENIAYLRKKNGYTKKRMAKLLGISVYQLNLIEKGIMPKKLSVAVLFSIHNSFGLMPYMLFERLEK